MGFLGRILGRHTTRVWRAELAILQGLGLVPPPVAVQWITTQSCDLRCPHCYSVAGAKARGELSLEEAEVHLFDELVRLGRPELVLAGGEPLLRPDFAAIVDALRQRDIPWSLHTHGRHVARHRSALTAYPPRMAAVSLDGPPDVHDHFRGRPGSFEGALEAMRMLRELGVPELIAGTTVHRGNIDRLDRMLPQVAASGASGWGLHLVTPEGRAAENPRLLPTPDQIRRAVAFARKARAFLRVELDNEWGSAGPRDALYRDASFYCGAGRVSCVVSASGELMPCTTTDVDESAGSIRNERLSRLWTKGFSSFRRQHQDTDRDPRDCWLQTRHGCSCRPSAFGDLDIESELRALMRSES
ncbi:MAG: radical SAM protein [Planctomycetes bacterium]|nr:radical SAM protein [Planctomycetota bacterium]